MFKKNKEIKTKAIDELRKKAIKEDDMETLDILNDISNEHTDELFKARIKYMVIGAGLTNLGFIIGMTAMKLYESRNEE
jgi:pheromone shutdown protein TraB